MFDRLSARYDDLTDREDGFTLIELLVVVVIIGILIAIAIPLYLNYQRGAKDKSAQSDLRGAVSTAQQCYTDNSNAYATNANVSGAGTGDTVTDMTGTVSMVCGTVTETVNLSDGTHMSYDLTSGVVTMKTWNTGGNRSSSGNAYTYVSSQGGKIN